MSSDKTEDSIAVSKRVESTLLAAASLTVVLVLAFLVCFDSRISW